MSDRTQDLKNLRAVAVACKSYTDNKIDHLKWELGTYDLGIESDNTTAYQKIVPSGSIQAKINKLGGMSYKSENIYTENPQPTINLTAGTNKWQGLNDIPIVNGKTYTVKFFNTRVANEVVQFMNYSYATINYSGTYTFTANTDVLQIRIGNGDLSGDINYQLQMMIVEGNVAPTEFKVGYEGIRDSAVTSVESYGANLLALNDVAETTINGITYSVSNGLITLNGTATNNTYIFLNLSQPLTIGVSELYSSLGGTTASSTQWYLTSNNSTATSGGYRSDNKLLNNGLGRTATTLTNIDGNNTYTQIYIYIASRATLTNYIVKLMLVKGSTAPTEYKPYVAPITKTIPAEVQALTSYGWGINSSCYNYIYYDNVRKKWFYVQKVDRVDLGTLTWQYNSANNVFYASISNKVIYVNVNQNILCAKYSNANTTLENMPDKTIIETFIGNNKDVAIKDTSYNGDTATFKTAMSGVYLYYELATPIETDISQYIDNNFIEVEPNGTITFNNTYEQAVPSEIDYLVEEVKA